MKRVIIWSILFIIFVIVAKQLESIKPITTFTSIAFPLSFLFAAISGTLACFFLHIWVNEQTKE